MRPWCGVLAMAVAATVAVAAQDWNQWRGPSRSGAAAAFTPPAKWPDRPTRAWQVTVGEGHSSPVVADGRVFVHIRIGEQEAATAFDLKSGRQVWQQRYDAPYEMNYAARAHGKGPKSTPVVAGGRLFTLGIDGVISAFDAATGKRIWQKHHAREFDAASPDFGTAMSPLVEGGMLIVHVGGSKTGALMALDVATGEPKWTWKGDGPGYASPVVGTIAGTRQIVTQSRSFVIGLDASTGRLLWRVPLTTEYNQNIVTPVISDDLVIYTGIGKPLAAVRVVLNDGKWTTQPVWQNDDVPMYMSSPVLAGDYIFGFTHRNKGQFVCVDAKTGKTLWTTRGREAENASLVIAGDLLLASTTEGELVVARRDPAKFDVIRRYTVAESPVWAHPVPAGRGVLIKDAETLAYWTF